MNHRKSLTVRILKGSLIVFIFTSLTPPLGYLIKMIYSRSLSIEMFGLFYATLSFFTLLASFTDLGFNYCLTYLLPKYFKNKDYKTCWKLYKYNQIISLGTSLLISLLAILCAEWLSDNYFKVSEAKQIIYVFTVFLIGGSLLNTIERFFMGLQQEKYYSVLQSVKIFLALTFSTIIWLTDNSNVFYYSIAWAASTIIVTLLISFILKRRYHYMVSKVGWDKKLFKLMLNYALPSLLTTFVISFTGSVGTITLTLIKGVKEVGIYEIVIPLATMSSIVLSPINTFILPLISHLEDENEKLQKLLENALKIIPFIGFYFALFTTLFPEQPIHMLFGEKWINMAKSPLVVLSIGYVIAQTSNFLATVVVGIGKIKERLITSIIVALISIVLTYIFVSRYSVLGVTISLLILYTVSAFINTKIILNTISFKFPTKLYLKLLVFGFLAYIFVDILNIQPYGFIQYLLFGAVYTIIMGGLALLLNLFNKNMLESLLKG